LVSLILRELNEESSISSKTFISNFMFSEIGKTEI